MPQDPLKQSLRRAIGATARETRLRQGLTQEDVADRLDIATEVYGRIERGTLTPSLITLRKLCMALSLSADRLLSTGGSGGAPTLIEAEPPRPPESRHMRRMIRRARMLPPSSLRLLCRLAAGLPKKTSAKPPRLP